MPLRLFSDRQWHPASIILAAVPILFTLHRILKNPCRFAKVPKTKERVLILGASSGIGRAIAHLYSARGASVCVVGRRKAQLNQVVEECSNLADGDKTGTERTMRKVLGIVADFANVEDMLRVRTTIEQGTSILPFPFFLR